jgi:hypothetical protein
MMVPVGKGKIENARPFFCGNDCFAASLTYTLGVLGRWKMAAV